MAKVRKQKLKVFRTAAGFDDAFVAAPSRKAALEAWGAGTDLFSAGIAEEVRDPKSGPAEAKAAKAVLAKPGEVVRVRRGGGKDVRPSTGSGRTEKGNNGKSKAKPKPSRAAVEKAEAALAELDKKQSAERAALAKEEEELAKRRRALEDKQARARDQAQAKFEAAEERYRKAMREWEH